MCCPNYGDPSGTRIMNAKATHSADSTNGIHEWVDLNGNQGVKILSQHYVNVHIAMTNGIFDPNKRKASTGLTFHFNTGGNLKRKLLVVVDDQLSESMKCQIEGYFRWCKTEGILQDYLAVALVVRRTEKTVRNVSTLITAAKQFGLRRRDLFVAIGNAMATDIVGIAAAMYRRSTPWILVPTDIINIIRSPVCENALSMDHISHDGKHHRAAFIVSHPPIASVYDLSLLSILQKADVKDALAEMIKLSIHRSAELFSYVEAYGERISAIPQDAAFFVTAIEFALRAVVTEHGQISQKKMIPTRQ